MRHIRIIVQSLALTALAAGTMLSFARVDAQKNGEVTYANQVSRIVQKRCQSCHHDEGQAPFALMTYDQAKGHAKTIKESITEKRMPPWHADPKYGKFLNDRRLPPEELDTLVKWIDAGVPKGNEKELPPAIDWPKGWVIGKPDVVVSMPQEYSVPAEGVIEYQMFRVDPGFKEDLWVERAEAKAGSNTVHHILVFLFAPGARAQREGMSDAPVLCGTAPGDMPLILQPGYAKKIPAGSQLVFQMHYTPNGKAAKDRSSIGLIFAKQPPKHEVKTKPLGKRDIAIQPNTPNHREEATFTFDDNVRVLSFMPHMHLRGKSFEYRLVQTDGKESTLLNVPRYDFGWQTIYRFAEAPVIRKGEKLHCIATWDNSKNNRQNPDPNKTITFGQQTWDEMMQGWMDYVVAE